MVSPTSTVFLYLVSVVFAVLPSSVVVSLHFKTPFTVFANVQMDGRSYSLRDLSAVAMLFFYVLCFPIGRLVGERFVELIMFIFFAADAGLLLSFSCFVFVILQVLSFAPSLFRSFAVLFWCVSFLSYTLCPVLYCDFVWSCVSSVAPFLCRFLCLASRAEWELFIYFFFQQSGMPSPVGCDFLREWSFLLLFILCFRFRCSSPHSEVQWIMWVSMEKWDHNEFDSLFGMLSPMNYQEEIIMTIDDNKILINNKLTVLVLWSLCWFLKLTFPVFF